MKLTALSVVLLALGVALGLALQGTVFEAEAKPPPPGPQAVEEQNLDGSGFIAVHEQGTVDVIGTVDVGNLPAVQDVNVLSQPAPEGRLIELTLTSDGSRAVSPFVDISDCGVISVFSRGTVEDDFFASPDGTIRIKAGFTKMGAASSAPGSSGGGSQINVSVALPFIQITSQPTTTTEAWIWCAP